MNLRRSISSMGVFLAFATAALADRSYTITDLGDFGFGSIGVGINSFGDVAGYANIDANTTHSFVYSAGTLYKVGTLGGSNSNFLDINALGHPVGISQIGAGPAEHAFVHAGDAGLHDLGTLGGTGSTATAINENDFIVGFSDTADGHVHAFGVYAEGMQDLGTLGGNDSAAYGVNDYNDVVGTSETNTAGVFAAAAWTEDGQKFNLGHLGGTPSEARSINNHGQVVGFSYIPGNTIHHAFYYYEGQIHDLGTLGGSNSKAFDININGEVVGESDISGGGAVHAFLVADGYIYDLNGLIPTNSGWTLINANSINDSGQITGYGINPQGITRAYLLTLVVPPIAPPAPDIKGKSKVTTTKSKLRIKGTATGSVTSVTYVAGKKKGRAAGTNNWSFTANFKRGRNAITVTAHGPGGSSTAARMTVILK